MSRPDGKLLWWGRRGDSTQRSNIEVQNLGGSHLSVAEGLVFVGGPDRATGTVHPFVAVDAQTGRMWGADDTRLAAKAGRQPNGQSTNVERGLYGTRPINFGQDIAPIVADGGVFTFGWKGSFRDLKAYLETQFGSAAGRLDKWSNPVPTGTLLVAADTIVGADGKILRVVSRADGKEMWQADFAHPVLPNGLAAAGGGLYASTKDGDVCCLRP